MDDITGEFLERAKKKNNNEPSGVERDEYRSIFEIVQVDYIFGDEDDDGLNAVA